MEQLDFIIIKSGVSEAEIEINPTSDTKVGEHQLILESYDQNSQADSKVTLKTDQVIIIVEPGELVLAEEVSYDPPTL